MDSAIGFLSRWASNNSSAVVASFAAIISIASAIASNSVALTAQRRQYFSELRRWADGACDDLSEAVHACDLDPKKMGGKFFELRHQLRCRLSSRIDRGRWFYPNVKPHFNRGNEEAAFRGFRQPALDCLVSAYRIITDLDYAEQDPNLKVRDQLVQLQKGFVNVIYEHLDPSKRRDVLKNLMEYRKQKKMKRAKSRS